MTPEEIKKQQDLIRDRYAQDQVSREKAVNDIAENLGKLVRQHLDECTRTCVNCQHFAYRAVVCNLNGQKPPPRIIAFGCEFYKDNIPF